MEKIKIDIEKLKLPEVISFDELPDGIKSINCPLSADAEMTVEMQVDENILNKLLGVDLAVESDQTFEITAKQPYRVQKRKHKKKRINKKWAKRYGYDVKFKDIKIERCKLNALHNNGFEITGNPLLTKNFNI